MAMEEGALSCLLRLRPVLEQDIKATYLMDHLVSDGVLSVDEEEHVRSKVETRSRRPTITYQLGCFQRIV